MEKINIIFSDIKPVRIEFGDNTIEIKKRIPLETRTNLTKWYIDAMLDETKSLADRFWEAEMTLLLGIVDVCTNIAISFEEHAIDVEKLIASGLWDEIKKNIVDYDDFRNELIYVVGLAIENKRTQNSVGSLAEDLMVKVTDFLNKISEMDLSEDGVGKLLKKFDETINGFNDKYVAPPKVKAKKK